MMRWLVSRYGLRYKLKQWYYRVRNRWLSRYGLRVGGFNAGHPPKFGKGKYVSVYKHGPYIDMVNEGKEDFIVRLIPYQPNHGVFVEVWRDGQVGSRICVDMRKLAELAEGNRETTKSY